MENIEQTIYSIQGKLEEQKKLNIDLETRISVMEFFIDSLVEINKLKKTDKSEVDNAKKELERHLTQKYS
jgi:hypothetical protein